MSINRNFFIEEPYSVVRELPPPTYEISQNQVIDKANLQPNAQVGLDNIIYSGPYQSTTQFGNPNTTAQVMTSNKAVPYEKTCPECPPPPPVDNTLAITVGIISASIISIILIYFIFIKKEKKGGYYRFN